jgi:hypothetical protein
MERYPSPFFPLLRRIADPFKLSNRLHLKYLRPLEVAGDADVPHGPAEPQLDSLPAAVDREYDRGAIRKTSGKARVRRLKGEPAVVIERDPLMFVHRPDPFLEAAGRRP